MKPLLALILGSLLAAAPTMPGAAAAADDAVLGTWLTHEENAHVEISRCEEETFCGEIVWLSTGATNGLGFRILEGFTYAGDNQWKDGTLTNPRDGNSRDAELLLEGDDVLKIRVSAGLLRRTLEWTRVPDDQP